MKLKLTKSKKNNELIIFLVSIIMIWSTYVIISKCIDTYKNKQFNIYKDSFLSTYQIDDLVIDNETISIFGWYFKIGDHAKNTEVEVILYDELNNKKYFTDVKRTSNENVNTYFKCEYDYSDCGFIAKINEKKLDLEHSKYEILFRYNKSKAAYRTGIYLENGSLVKDNSYEHFPTEIENSDLLEIIRNGKLCFCEAEYGMCVYQYTNKLYWIANDAFYFEDDNTTNIQYSIDTTQINKLPSARVENGIYFDNRGFTFEDKEIKELETDKYRVAMMELPSEYSVTKITTGYYTQETGWVWRKEFRPWYTFK